MPKTDALLDHVYAAVRAAVERRAGNPVVLKVSKLTSYADYFVLLSGSSDRRVQSIAEGVRQTMKEAGVAPLGVEGMKEGRWALLDFGAFVVHVFYDEVRPLFDLEGLWADAERVEIPASVLAPAPRATEQKP